MAERKTHEGGRVELSESFANWLNGLANWGLVVSLVVGVISTVLIVWTGNVKEDFLKKQLGDATKLAAQADLSRNNLQNRILDIFGSRGFRPDQTVRIVKALAGLTGEKIDVFVVDPGNAFTSSDDSIPLGHELLRTLRMAGMDAHGWIMSSCFGVQAMNVTLFTLPSGKRIKIASRVRDALSPEIPTASAVGNSAPYCRTVVPLEKEDSEKQWKGMNENTIGIAIGSKIQPILTREMLDKP
jgi:hypothetical protein